jgi:hypothetical protein
MYRKYLIFPILIIAFVSLACSVSITLPNLQNKIGPTETDTIDVSLPENTQTVPDVTLNCGICDLNLQPGSSTSLVSGTVKYNVADLKPTVTVNGNNVTIQQGNFQLTGIPFVNTNVINDWNLSLANSPMNLYVKAGAYTGNYELGGLSIQHLEVTDGASRVKLNFSEPNQIEMTSFKYMTGASEVSLMDLSNANADEIAFNGGAGNYTLDFSGVLSRDVMVSIDAGISSVTVIVPNGVPAELTTNSTLITVNTSGGWQQSGNTYLLSGSGYKINITAKMGAGSLQLQTTSSGK